MSKSVLITGASGGLGLETAVHLAERGFRVYATMPDLSERHVVDEAASRHGVELHVLKLDVTDQISIDEAVQTVVGESGGIYGLVNNAGVALRGYFEDLLDEEIRRAFDVNVFGTMEVTRAVLPHMRAAGQGRVVIVTSIGGRIGSLAVSAYSSCKFAQEGFGESLYQEVKPLGIGVSLVAPAIVPTERWDVHRGYAKNALNPDSPYHDWFIESQRLTDKLVESTPTRPVHIARTIHHALTAKNPKLRYMVGWRANLVVTLRRYLPGELFERLYFGEVVRRVTKGQLPERDKQEKRIG